MTFHLVSFTVLSIAAIATAQLNCYACHSFNLASLPSTPYAEYNANCRDLGSKNSLKPIPVQACTAGTGKCLLVRFIVEGLDGTSGKVDGIWRSCDIRAAGRRSDYDCGKGVDNAANQRAEGETVWKDMIKWPGTVTEAKICSCTKDKCNISNGATTLATFSGLLLLTLLCVPRGIIC